MIFFENETAINIKLCVILAQLKQKPNQIERMIDFVDLCIIDSVEQDLSTKYCKWKTNH